MNVEKLNHNYQNLSFIKDQGLLASSFRNLGPIKEKTKLKILCALTSKYKQNKLAKILSTKNCDFHFAQNGWFCIQKAHNAKVKKNPYDLVIVSADLKVLDGFTVATKLANLSLTKQIIITSTEKFYSYEIDSLSNSGASFLEFRNLTKMLSES